MKRILLFVIIISGGISLLFAQTEREPSQEFSLLKKSYFTTSKENKSSKHLKELTNRIDEFLSHVKIEKGVETHHNMIPYLTCAYDNSPLSVLAYLRSDTKIDTISFQDGKWYISNDITEDMEIDILTPEMDGDNKTTEKLKKTIGNKHKFRMKDILPDQNGSVFFVKDENLYYAAIESKKIPAFDILSNSGVINFASCLKAILKASGVEVMYDEIIREYLNTTIDEQIVPMRNNSTMIAGRKVATKFISQTEISATEIVNELVKERFMIAIDQNGNIGLLTAIALTGETDYQPVHIRMRMPMLGKEEQRVQMSWKDFCSRMIALVRVDVY